MRTILIATDGSSSSGDALAVAVELAAKPGAELIIMHVAPLYDTEWSLDEDVGPVLHEPAERDCGLLRDAAALAGQFGVHASIALLRGSVADEIVAYGNACDVDLIIVGSRGHGAAVSVLLGSVSLAVLSRATRPVLIVHGARSRKWRRDRAATATRSTGS